MRETLQIERIETDVLIVGGGTAGCYAALTLAENSPNKVLIAEKANIKRSGCLAAGVNAINAYIVKGRTPEDYVDYATKDAAGIVRRDLLLSAARRFNQVTEHMESLGLVILKDENGEYVARGNRNIKINGENFKPILAKAVTEKENIEILNYVNITDLLVEGNQIYGAVGFSIVEEKAYIIRAKAVLIATGGAAGLYRPNNPGFSRHKMWYPPFNTGAGYAMGLRAGAEMTSFEMRFIALRCKDTIAPTGTIAQGVRAKQVNSRGFVYEDKYGLTTSERVYGTVKENQLGNGPCYLRTSVITKEQDQQLLKAYLNMAPSQTLKWLESGKMPSEQDVEIQGTEPYIVGGHTASGYWVDTHRQTTVHGLYAAGDVAGGCPQKYVTGALAEGEIAAESILAQLKVQEQTQEPEKISDQAETIVQEYEKIRNSSQPLFSTEELEEAMQKVMDEYAGGISSYYQYNEKQLDLAEEKVKQLQKLSEEIGAADMHELLFAYELKERLLVCQALIAHLKNRKETRWHSFNENLDYPDTDSRYFKYINSKLENEKIQIYFRDIVEEDTYEHTALHDLIRGTIREHKRIIFNGDGYDDSWVVEAEKRGLLNLKTTPDALAHILEEKNIRLFTTHKVYSETEIRARHEVKLESYCKVINIEAQTMLEMARKDILPAMSRFTAELGETIAKKAAVLPDADCTYEKETLRSMSALVGSGYRSVKKLEQDLLNAKSCGDVVELADFFKTVIISDMRQLRIIVDEMETMSEGKQWPYPSYGQILFGVR